MDETLTIGVFTCYFPNIDSLLCHHLTIYIAVPANIHIITLEDQLAPAVIYYQLILDYLVINTREEHLVVVLSLNISSTGRSIRIRPEYIREQ